MIAIISDIHGNYPALEAVLADVDANDCAQIVCLGDVAGYYCMLNECVEALRARSVRSLLGNHDHYLVTGAAPTRSAAAARCIDYQRRTVTRENLAWLANASPTLRIADMSMVHGGWIDPLDEYLVDVREDYFADRDGTFFFSGHTHVQVVAAFRTKTYCNPGSVGQPRDGDHRAAYALFDEGRITLRRVAYDIDRIAGEMRRAGFDAHFYENLYLGRRIGGGVSRVSVG